MRIDVHHHIFPPSIDKADQSARVGFRTPPENLPWTPEVSLSAMDRLGISKAILSLPAGLPPGPPGLQNRAAARVHNDHAADICAKHPDRFAFFACVPNLFDVEGASKEISRALDSLNACGVVLSSSYGEGEQARYIADEAFDLIWEQLDRREAVVFLHGAQTPSSTPYPHPFLGIPITEVPNETFKAAAHLVVTGKKRRYRKVKIILAHLGGSVPFLAPRVAALSRYMGCPLSHEEIMQDFKSFYYETALSGDKVTLAAMEAFVEPDHILFGSDFPAVSIEIVEHFARELDEHYHGDLTTNTMALWRNPPFNL